jgi:outer membrane receptor protein involved in Fe transport
MNRALPTLLNSRVHTASKLLLLIFAALVSFTLLPSAFGQTSSGSVQGLVKDPTGAVVSGANVTIVSSTTGLTRSTKTDSGGSYALLDLSPGQYQITAEAPGFARTEQRVVVAVGSRIGLDLALTVGKGNEVVEVVGGGGTVVNIVNQEVSSVVTSEEIAQLPTLTRNPYDLVATAANAQQDSQAGVGDARGAGYSLNGQRSASTSILLDGGENVDLYTATVGQTVPLDSVQEFRVVSNGMTAEYGRASGGVVNVVTKSGTNAFHGSAYEFNRVAALSSNTYQNSSNSLPKGGFTRNQFGFSIGGPIKKDKLFFFNNTEWVRVRSSAPFITVVPDPAFIAAANSNTQSFFSAYGKLRSNLTTVGVATQADVVGAPGFSAGPALAALPGSTPIWDTVTYNVPGDAGGGAPQNTYMTVGRVDLNISDKTQLFGRYALYNEKDFDGYINTSPYVGYETGQKNLDNNFLLSVNHTFGTSFLSNTRLIFTRLNGPVQPLGAAPVGPTLYFSNSAGATFAGDRIAFPGYNEYTPGNAIPFGGPQNLGQIYQDFSYVHHSHTFRFGGQYIRLQDNRLFGAYEEAVEALSTGGGSTAYDNFLNGNLSLFQAAVDPQGKFPCSYDPTTGAQVVTPACTVTLPVSSPSFSRSNNYNDSAIYGQDTWKVTHRLTLNLGLRWEYYGVQHNRNPNLDSNFYYGSGSDIFTQIRNGSVQIAPKSPVGGLWQPQKKNFGPRFGFAYDVFGDGKTSLRGGYGIAYERNFGNVTYNVIQNPPAYAVLALTPLDVGGPIPVTNSNAGPLAGSSGSKALPRVSLRHVSQNIKTAYTEQWNFGLEREIAPSVIASLGYDGARGIHQYSISNINEQGFAQIYLGDTSPNFRLNNQYSNVNNRGSQGDSYYHAMVAALRGTKKGIQWNANYTYSHSIDTLSSTFSDEVVNNGLGYVDPFNPGLDKGSSDYDARHRVSISAVVPIPFFNNSSSGFLKNALGGWQFAPIYNYRTGYPFSVFDCTNSISPYNCPRGDVIPGAKVPKSGSAGPDLGGNLFNYMNVPGIPGDYAGPQFYPGTTNPLPLTGSNLPTCTGLYHSGCSFPSNMLRRNAFVGPGNWNLNLGVYKDFKLTERVGLQLRGEFFDLTNHKNFYVLGFGYGGADFSSGSTIVQAVKGGYGNPFDDHRNLQLALKLTF